MSQRYIIIIVSVAIAMLGIGAIAVATSGATTRTLAVVKAPGAAVVPVTLVAQTTPSQAPRQIPNSQAQVQLSFAPVVKAVTPGVVNVYATTVSPAVQSPFANDPLFHLRIRTRWK